MQPQSQLIYHQSPAALFAFQALRVIDQSPLDPYERTALLHFCAVAGTPENPVLESLRDSASHCNMSVGKFHGVRASLVEKGWLTLEDGIVGITDKWRGDEPQTEYTPPLTGTAAVYTTSRSLHEQTCSPHEQTPLPTVHHMNAPQGTSVHYMNIDEGNSYSALIPIVGNNNTNTYNGRYGNGTAHATDRADRMAELVKAFGIINAALVEARKRPIDNVRGLCCRILDRGETLETMRATYKRVMESKVCENKVGAFVAWCWSGSEAYLSAPRPQASQQQSSVY